MSSLRPLAAAVLAALLAAPGAARAHGVSQEVERRGDAFAVRVRYHGGKPIAGAVYEVLRPGSAAAVREGKTGPDGWVEFVPDVPGMWQVKVVDRTGHGKTVSVEVAEVARSIQTPSTSTTTSTSTTASTSTSTSTTASTSTSTSTTPASTPDDAPGALRTAVAAAALLAVFVVLAAVRRRRAPSR